MEKSIEEKVNSLDHLQEIWKTWVKALDDYASEYGVTTNSWEEIKSWLGLEKEIWQLIESLKSDIKNGEEIGETKLFKISTSKSYKVNPEKFKTIVTGWFEKYVKTEEKISKAEIDKAIKSWELSDEVKDAYEITGMTIKFTDKEKILQKIAL